MAGKDRQKVTMKGALGVMMQLQATREEKEWLPAVTLEGPRGTGKTTLPRQFAKALGIPCIVREAAFWEPSDVCGLHERTGDGKH